MVHGWSFGKMEGGVVQGFRHSGIDLFRGHRLDRMVRECIQNALDASNKDLSEPVVVALTLNNLDSANHDALSGLEPFLKLGLQRSETVGSEDEKNWYKNAIAVVNQPSVRVLGIHDANTIGLVGSANKKSASKSRWLALVAGQGVNLGQNNDGLGGFGHGSNAAFAMSRIRTAFYLSPTIDENGNDVVRFQGHSLLQTLFDADNNQTAPDGFFGELAGFEVNPVTSPNIPEWFASERQDAVGEGRGTSVFVCHPYIDDDEQAWREILVSVVANFALAIHMGNLRVKLGNGDVIEKETLDDAFMRVAKLHYEFGDNSDGLRVTTETWKNLESVRTMLRPTISSGAHPLVVKGFGEAHWFLRLGDEVKKRTVTLAREPGMVITSKAPSLGPMALNKYLDFDLLVCVRAGSDDSGAVVVKQMEDPSHTSMAYDWVSEEHRSTVRRRYEMFTKAVKTDILDVHAMPVQGEIEVIAIDGLLTPALLGDESEHDSISDIRITVGARPRRTPKMPTPKPGDGGMGQGRPPEGDGGDGGPGGRGGNPPPSPTGALDVEGVRYEKSNIRYLQIFPTGKVVGEYTEMKIFGHQLVRGASRLVLFAAGESVTDYLPVRIDPLVPLEPSAQNSVPFGNGNGGRQEAVVWIPNDMTNLAFGGVLYRGV